MADAIFSSYAEAASYAKRRSIESGLSVQFSSQNGEWVVFDPGLPRQRENQSVNESPQPTPDGWVRGESRSDGWGRGESYSERMEKELAREKSDREERQREKEEHEAHLAVLMTYKTGGSLACRGCGNLISQCRCR